MVSSSYNVWHDAKEHTPEDSRIVVSEKGEVVWYHRALHWWLDINNLDAEVTMWCELPKHPSLIQINGVVKLDEQDD